MIRARSQRWQLRSRELRFGPIPAIMGILNVTPDSFSDGGDHFALEPAVQHARALVAAGADIVDVGGESTRPYSDPVPVEEELNRVVPVVQAIVTELGVPVSIDTSKPQVAAACIDVGAEIVNDVTGLRDPRMRSVVRDREVGACVMHMQGNPQTMQDAPAYQQVTNDILEHLRERRQALIEEGIDPARICLDPGIGFGKTHDHNVTLMRQCGKFHELGCPVMVGHSRKAFLARILGDREADRAAVTAGAAAALASSGIQVIRVHDVRVVRETLMGFVACQAPSELLTSLTRSRHHDESPESLRQPRSSGG